MDTISVTVEDARKLFLVKQNLAGKKLSGSFPEKVTSLMRDTAYIQWDPVTVVAPSHLISLWSRLGDFSAPELEKMLFKSKEIFLHWAPIAYMVLTEDYPIFYSLMKSYPGSLGRSWNNHIKSANDFLQAHAKLKEDILEKLNAGPAEIGQLKELGKIGKSPDGWSPGNDAATMLHHLHMMGKIMVAGHDGNQNVWALSDDFLPASTSREVHALEELERITALRSLKSLGVGTDFDINRYFVRGRYWKLKEALGDLLERSKIQKVEVAGEQKRRTYYIRTEDLPELDRLDRVDWNANMRLISPFDNIISIRERLKRLFNFEYTLEQFLPREKRKFGTYVIPILWKDKLVGRFDAKLDRQEKTLNIVSVHAEPGFENELEIPDLLGPTLKDFAGFLNAERVEYSSRIPALWARFLNEDDVDGK